MKLEDIEAFLAKHDLKDRFGVSDFEVKLYFLLPKLLKVAKLAKEANYGVAMLEALKELEE